MPGDKKPDHPLNSFKIQSPAKYTIYWFVSIGIRAPSRRTFLSWYSSDRRRTFPSKHNLRRSSRRSEFL